MIISALLHYICGQIARLSKRLKYINCEDALVSSSAVGPALLVYTLLFASSSVYKIVLLTEKYINLKTSGFKSKPSGGEKFYNELETAVCQAVPEDNSILSISGIVLEC